MLSNFIDYQRGLYALLLSAFALTTAAQNAVSPPEIKFGQVTPADFTRQPIPADTTAEAVVLYESADTRFTFRNEHILRVTDYYSRIRINKKSAYDRSTVEIPLHGRSSQQSYVQNIEGVTYTLDKGQVLKKKMDKAAVVLERVSDNLSLQKLTLPGVQEGCVIEYRYSVYSPGEETPPSWAFQQDIPVVWSDYKVTISNHFYFKVIMAGYLQLAVYTSQKLSEGLIPGNDAEGSVRSHYAVANAPAFRNEPYITTPRDYLSRIEFELASINVPGYVHKNYALDWSDIDKTLLEMESFAPQYQKAPYLRNVAEDIRAKHPATDTLGRVTAAYNYIRNTMTWNEKGNYRSDRLKKVLELKKGDAADLNFMLIGLLRELGLEANPVILSTRPNGQINEHYGLLRQFNYVVAHLMLGGRDFMLDATDRLVKPGMLPFRALNRRGRLIRPAGQSRFVSLLPTERDVEARTGLFSLSADGEVTGNLIHSYGGYGAVEARASYQQKGEPGFVDQIKQRKPDWQIEKATFSNVDDLNAAMLVNYTLTVTDVAQVAGDRLYLRPMLTEGQTENPFKQLERQFPVDFAHPIDETFSVSYRLPEGYSIEELPKPLALSLPENGGRFTYQVQLSNGQLIVSSRISIRKPVFSADEYEYLREFYEKIMLKHGEQVVLKKEASAPASPVADQKSGATPAKKQER